MLISPIALWSVVSLSTAPVAAPSSSVGRLLATPSVRLAQADWRGTPPAAPPPQPSAPAGDFRGYPAQAPPAPVVETMRPRSGFVWVAGHYDWRRNGYVWVPGYWLRERRGHHFHAGRWELRGDRYFWVEGEWLPDGGPGAPAPAYVEAAPPAPPAPVTAVMPAPRPGFIWIPGAHEWRDGRYVWVEGRWEHERPGARWHPGHWDHEGRRAYWHPGEWHEEHEHDQERHHRR
jgi:hypothetical protein